MHCREAFTSIEGLLFHLENVGDILNEALQTAKLIQLEIHGCEAELAKLREPLADLSPKFFVPKYGFRN